MAKVKIKASAFDKVAQQWKPFGGTRYSYKEGELYVYSIRPRHNVIRSKRLKNFLDYIAKKMAGKGKFGGRTYEEIRAGKPGNPENVYKVQRELAKVAKEASAAVGPRASKYV